MIAIELLEAKITGLEAENAALQDKLAMMAEALEEVRPLAESCNGHELSRKHPNETVYSYNGGGVTFNGLQAVLKTLSATAEDVQRWKDERTKQLDTDFRGNSFQPLQAENAALQDKLAMTEEAALGLLGFLYDCPHQCSEEISGFIADLERALTVAGRLSHG